MRAQKRGAPAALLVGVLLGAPLAARPALAESTLNVSKLSSDGLEVRQLSCKLTTGGLFGPIFIVGALAKQKAAFDKCAAGGAAFQVEFVWKDGKTASARVTASSEAKANACVAAALKLTDAPVGGTCSAIVLTGDMAKAEEAAAALGKKK
jgi:hypothetical protein